MQRRLFPQFDVALQPQMVRAVTDAAAAMSWTYPTRRDGKRRVRTAQLGPNAAANYFGPSETIRLDPTKLDFYTPTRSLLWHRLSRRPIRDLAHARDAVISVYVHEHFHAVFREMLANRRAMKAFRGAISTELGVPYTAKSLSDPAMRKLISDALIPHDPYMSDYATENERELFAVAMGEYVCRENLDGQAPSSLVLAIGHTVDKYMRIDAPGRRQLLATEQPWWTFAHQFLAHDVDWQRVGLCGRILAASLDL